MSARCRRAIPEERGGYRDAMPLDRDHVLANLATIRSGIEAACDRAGRDPAEVLLVAAAKTRARRGGAMGGRGRRDRDR